MQSVPLGAFSAHGLLTVALLATNCWPEAPLVGWGGGGELASSDLRSRPHPPPGRTPKNKTNGVSRRTATPGPAPSHGARGHRDVLEERRGEGGGGLEPKQFVYQINIAFCKFHFFLL